jgi:hypothetical protein
VDCDKLECFPIPWDIGGVGLFLPLFLCPPIRRRYLDMGIVSVEKSNGSLRACVNAP